MTTTVRTEMRYEGCIRVIWPRTEVLYEGGTRETFDLSNVGLRCVTMVAHERLLTSTMRTEVLYDDCIQLRYLTNTVRTEVRYE